MRIIALALGLTLLSACAVDPAGAGGPGGTSVARAGSSGTATGARLPAGTASTAVVMAPVSATHPEGVWVMGDSTEPGPGAVVACKANQTLTLQLQAGEMAGSINTCAGLCEQLERLEGTYVDGVATLYGSYKGNLENSQTLRTEVLYTLTYNPRTQHLVGHRDGRPVWAAPFLVSKAAECQPSPTPVPIPTHHEGTVIPVGSF